VLSLVIAPPEDGLPTKPDRSTVGGNVWRDADGQVVAFSSTSGNVRSLHWPGVASFRFQAGSDHVTAVPYPSTRSDLIHPTFRHSVLPLVLQALGREAIHASAILSPQGVIGFCGHAHAGKSTLAYALSDRGYPAWSDDAVVFEVDGGTSRAVLLPFEFRLRPASADLFGRSPGPAPARQDRTPGRAPIAALCSLVREPADASKPAVVIRKLKGHEALAAVLEHSLCFDMNDRARKQTVLVNYLTLLSSVQVFEVRLRPGLDRLSGVVDAVVSDVIAPLQVVPRAQEIPVTGPRPEPAGIGSLRY
jgi:hypothetical protein